MLNTILTKVIGTKNERELKAIRPVVHRINELEATILPLSETQLKEKTEEFRRRLKGTGDGGGGESLDALLPEAFAVVREAGRRVLNMRHFDVQLIGGLALHRGMIAEMKTGEGKTLVATLASYLNALEGKGVHIVTVNDYLAKRDSDWMGRIFRFLGLDPIAPSEPVEGGANEKYFRQWSEMKRDLRMRAYLDLVSLRYERRVRRYGYSLLSPS